MTTNQQRRKPDQRPSVKEDERQGSRKKRATEVKQLRAQDRLLTRNYREF